MVDQRPLDEKLSTYCMETKGFYTRNPGLFGAGAAIDLYFVAATLAERAERMEEFLTRIAEFGEAFDSVERAEPAGRAIAATLAKHAREALRNE